MAFTYSPTSMKVYWTCPLKFYETYVTKEMPRPSGYALERGKRIHDLLQKSLEEGWQDMAQRDPQLCIGYCKNLIAKLRDISEQKGYAVLSEHEMAMTKAGEACEWGDENCFLRARADVILMHDDLEKPMLIGDFKTGAPPQDEFFQLRTEALLAHILYKRTKFVLQYWCVDGRSTKTELIDLSKNLNAVKDVFERLNDMQKSFWDNYWPRQHNFWCRWCVNNETEKCPIGWWKQ